MCDLPLATGVLNAGSQDVAEGSARCSALNTARRYQAELTITAEHLDQTTWTWAVDGSETCAKSATLGQVVVGDCVYLAPAGSSTTLRRFGFVLRADGVRP